MIDESLISVLNETYGHGFIMLPCNVSEARANFSEIECPSLIILFRMICTHKEMEIGNLSMILCNQNHVIELWAFSMQTLSGIAGKR